MVYYERQGGDKEKKKSKSLKFFFWPVILYHSKADVTSIKVSKPAIISFGFDPFLAKDLLPRSLVTIPCNYLYDSTKQP